LIFQFQNELPEMKKTKTISILMRKLKCQA